MADLDDFFAKKDKKKGKGKKFLTAEDLVRQLEDTSKREAVAKPKKPEQIVDAIVEEEKPKDQESDAVVTPTPNVVPVESVEIVEEEWKEFEEEKSKDYTGLKIGQLTVNDDDDNSPTEEEDDVDSDGNVGTDPSTRRQGSGGGPWKKVIPAEEVTQIPMEMEKPSSKVYISPALRNVQANALGRAKIRNRAAPDITNADYFPTLGAARPEEQRKKKNEPAFEEVRHGGRVQRVQETVVNAPASVTNRFQTLDDDDS